MSLKREDVLTILAQNIGIRGSAFPVASSALTAWAEGLGIRKGGHTVLYTGHMYQIIPFILGMQKREAFMRSAPSWGMTVARLINPVINLTRVITLGAAHPLDVVRYNRVLRDIATLLRACGVEFGYLYEYEEYAGALPYDMGLDRVFLKHAHRVYKKLKGFGIRRLITVDPHTTEMFKNVYPEVIEEFDIEVVNYLELLAERWRPKIKGGGHKKAFVIHDSCVYSRYLGIFEEPRSILRRIGVEFQEPLLSKRLTHCCGGPIESIFPERAKEVAKARMEQLEPLGREIVTMCPICHLNLGAVKDENTQLWDIATILRDIQKEQGGNGNG